MIAHRLGRFIRHTRRNPCPVCQDERCLSFADGGVFCFRRPNADDRPTASGLGWMHWLNGRPDNWQDQLALSVVPAATANKLPPDELHAVYDDLRALSSLSREHYRHLTERRGMTPDQIAARGYFTLGEGRSRIARQLIAKHGPHLLGRTPGLYLSTRGPGEPYPMLAGHGLATPIRDDAGRIVGINLRHETGAKYTILSTNPSGEYPYVQGCASGSPLNVARPLGPRPDPDPAPAWPRGKVSITEGILKSTSASDRFGEIVLGMPGMTNRSDVVATLQRLGETEPLILLDQEETERTWRAKDDLARDLVQAGMRPWLGSWNARYKGIDDLPAGEPIAVAPYPVERIARPGLVIDCDPPPMRSRPLLTLEEARAALDDRIARAFGDLGTEEPWMLQIGAGTGVGKSRAVTKGLTRLNEQGWPHRTVKRHGVPMAEPMRVLILAPTKQLCAEIVAALPPGLAMLQEGRNPDAKHPWGCEYPDLINLAGQDRQNPITDVCQTCCLRHNWTRMECNFGRSKERLKDARVVVAPNASYLNGSTELRHFDLIIFDEGMFDGLLEEIVIDHTRVEQWRLVMDLLDAQNIDQPTGARYPENSPFRRFINALGSVQARLPGADGTMLPALSDLHDILPELPAVIDAIRVVEVHESTGRYPCEMPEYWEAEDKIIRALRALRHLADAIADELPRPAGADTRLWKRRDGLVLRRPRHEIIDILRSKKTMVLDATPHPGLRFFFPEAETFAVDAPQHQHVVQITDLLGTKRELIDPDTHARVDAALTSFLGDLDQAVFFSRMAFARESAHPFAADLPEVASGWFDNQTRGVNCFDTAAGGAIVGYYCHPIDHLRSQVQAARFATPPPPSGERLDFLRYEWRGPDGEGKGRYCRADADADVTAAIRWSESSPVLQAIGRLRAVNRSPDAPARILILSNLPIPGLAVDRLTILEELGAPPSRRGANDAFRAQAAANAERSTQRGEETVRQVEQAIAALRAEGRPISRAEIHRRTGIRRQTLHENERASALIDAAIAEQGQNRGVRVGTHTNSLYPTLPGHPEITNVEPPPVDPTAAQRALSAVDAAPDQPAFRQANADLADRLAELARSRGREPVPRPVGGGSHPVAPPSVHVWQRADLPGSDVDGTASDGPLDLTRAGPGGF